MNEEEAKSIAKSFCRTADEIEWDGPYTVRGHRVWEIWYLCKQENEYEVAFKCLLSDGTAKTARGIGSLVSMLDDILPSASSATPNGSPIVANIIAIFVLLLLAVIIVAPFGVTIDTTTRSVAGAVFLALGAGVALRFLGFHLNIGSVDVLRLFGR